MCECQGNPLARVTLALGLPYLLVNRALASYNGKMLQLAPESTSKFNLEDLWWRFLAEPQRTNVEFWFWTIEAFHCYCCEVMNRCIEINRLVFTQYAFHALGNCCRLHLSFTDTCIFTLWSAHRTVMPFLPILLHGPLGSWLPVSLEFINFHL